jgi:uncharacterized iron-regulated membrane protein
VQYDEQVKRMDTEVLIAGVLALFGVAGYILLNFGSKEPPHRHGDLFVALYGACLAIMVLAGLFIQWPIEFPWQGLTAFYAVYGFAACVFLIYVAKGLRLWLPKEEDYYEKRGGRKE